MIFPIRLANAARAVIFRLFIGGRFKHFGRRAKIVAPLGIERPERIEIGDGVYVAPMSYLAVKAIGEDQGLLTIGAGSKLGRFNHLYASKLVRLGAKVLTANGVYISDNSHGYQDAGLAVMDQELVQLKEVTIGDGCWLGHNACVIGASLGRNCVVGAGSVVMRDAPDFCVLVGAPARIIRRFDIESGHWRATHSNGDFL